MSETREQTILRRIRQLLPSNLEGVELEYAVYQQLLELAIGASDAAYTVRLQNLVNAWGHLPQ